MASGVLTIDQTPCRASYGLYTASALLHNTVNKQRAVVMDNIAKLGAEGDRMARIENKKASSIPEMAADTNLSDPLEVGVVWIERPTIRYIPDTGNNIDMNV